MRHTTARRSFLRGHFSQTEQMRPPGSVREFFDLCTGCGDCARACPTGIIYKDHDGFPVVNLRAGECLFCSDCSTACPENAIAPAAGWSYRAKANAKCLAVNGVTCRSCEDQCDAQAIRFHLKTGGRATPQFDAELCTGCGACVAPCPSNAITIYQTHTHTQANREETSC